MPSRVPPTELPEGYLELYKLAVEMADRVSARRAVANSFFLTLNTGLVALLGSATFRWYGAAAGIVFAGTWWALLRRYRELNWAKFQVILAMEEGLPVKIYGDELALLPGPVRFGLGHELGTIERIVPWIFVAIYGIELIRQVAE